MATITVIGGTGYTGAAVVREAAARGHKVTAVGRSAPTQTVEGVEYVAGSVTSGDPSSLVASSDVVVAALSPRGELAGKVAGIYETIAETAEETGTLLVVVGGFSSLRRAPGGPRIAFSEELHPQFADEARELATYADWLATTPEELDWLFVSPAAGYGAFAPVESRGTYRVGGDVVLPDAVRELAAGDFAAAILDLVERREHHRAHLGVAY